MGENRQDGIRWGRPQPGRTKVGLPCSEMLMTGALRMNQSCLITLPVFWQALLPTGLGDEGCRCLGPDYQPQHSCRIQTLHSM